MHFDMFFTLTFDHFLLWIDVNQSSKCSWIWQPMDSNEPYRWWFEPDSQNLGTDKHTPISRSWWERPARRRMRRTACEPKLRVVKTQRAARGSWISRCAWPCGYIDSFRRAECASAPPVCADLWNVRSAPPGERRRIELGPVSPLHAGNVRPFLRKEKWSTAVNVVLPQVCFSPATCCYSAVRRRASEPPCELGFI